MMNVPNDNVPNDDAPDQGEDRPAVDGTAADRSPMAKAKTEYGSEDLQHLSDLDHVRRRPAMYIGDVTARGLHHLVYEVVDNSIDEAMAGYAKNISVTVNTDGSVTVEDDGRGIPVERTTSCHEEMGREVSTLEGVMTRPQVRRQVRERSLSDLRRFARRRRDRRQLPLAVVRSRGLPRRARLPAGIRTGHTHWARCKRVGTTKKRGTKTTFKPDSHDLSVHQVQLRHAVQAAAGVGVSELAACGSSTSDERVNEGDEFFYERGIVEFVEHLNRASDPVHPDVMFICTAKSKGSGFEVAMQYTTEYTENVHSYVNNIHTIEGGTHVSGFRSALTRSLNNYGKKENLFKDLAPTGDDFREGLDGGHLRARSASAVRRPDQDQTGQWRGRRDHQLGRWRVLGRSTWKKTRRTAKTDRPQRRAGRAKPARRPARPRTCFANAKMRSAAAVCRANCATASATRWRNASCTWWKAIRPAAAPKAAGFAISKPSCRCAARSSTPTSRAKTRCWPTKKCRA